jgi:hypothetical protein
VNATVKATAPVVVLDPVVHGRIIADMERVCEIANVPASFIRHSMKSFCQDGEIEWVRSFNVSRKDGLGGLALVGADHAETRCMAIAGTLVRNFIDARVISLNTIVSHPVEAMEPTVLVVPNLYLNSFGKQLTAWQVQSVYDVLLNRLTANKPTVVCVESLEGLKLAYGPVFAEHIKEHFQTIA